MKRRHSCLYPFILFLITTTTEERAFKRQAKANLVHIIFIHARPPVLLLRNFSSGPMSNKRIGVSRCKQNKRLNRITELSSPRTVETELRSKSNNNYNLGCSSHNIIIRGYPYLFVDANVQFYVE